MAEDDRTDAEEMPLDGGEMHEQEMPRDEQEMHDDEGKDWGDEAEKEKCLRDQRATEMIT